MKTKNNPVEYHLALKGEGWTGPELTNILSLEFFVFM